MTTKSVRIRDVEWDLLLNPEIDPLLSREILMDRFPRVNWDTQTSGIQVKEEVVDELAIAWEEHLESLKQKYPQRSTNSDSS